MIRTLAIIAACTLPSAALDISKYIDVLSFRTTHSSGMDFDGVTPGDIDYTQSSLFALLGKAGDSDGLMWVPALNYEYSSIDINAYPFGVGPLAPKFDDGLHQISLPNFLIYSSPNSNWFHGAYIAPAIYSDFDRIDSRDFFLSAAIGSGYQFNDCLTVGFGVYASDITNDPFLVAAPVFFWTPTEDWLVGYYGPRFVARHDLNDNHVIGLEAAWNGGSWSVDAFNTDMRLDMNSIRAGLYYKYRLAGETWLELGAGYTFANEITLNTPGGTNLFPVTLGDLESAPYVSLGITVNRW